MNDREERRAQPAGAEYDDLALLARLLVGLAYVGSDDLLARLRAIEPGVAADVEFYGRAVPPDETMAQMVSYLALGACLRGGRRLARGVRAGLNVSRQAAGWALGTADRLTRNRLARPLRQPVERGIWNTLYEGQQAIAQGRREAQTSRLLAGRTLERVVDDVIDAIIENPELMAAVQHLARQQSAGLTNTLADSTRRATTSADDLAKGLVRRLLRRGPRPARRSWAWSSSGQTATPCAPGRPSCAGWVTGCRHPVPGLPLDPGRQSAAGVARQAGPHAGGPSRARREIPATAGPGAGATARLASVRGCGRVQERGRDRCVAGRGGITE
ncbi:MAG: hypothetical protein P8189_19170 [Anaerolineae bacterium]